MRLPVKTGIAIALAAALSGCSLGSVLGGGGKPPTTLVTLTPEAAEPAQLVRASAAGKAVTIATPAFPHELSTVACPSRLRRPTSSMSKASTGRHARQIVRAPRRRDRAAHHRSRRARPDRDRLDPGLLVSGQLQHFGYDASTGQVVVTYDGSLSTAGGARVETRRFTATAPSDGTAASVGPALNRAANQVALDVAKWIGS